MSRDARQQRRNLDTDDVQAIEEILAEAALGDGLGELAVGGGDHPHVDLEGVVAPTGRISFISMAAQAASPADPPAGRRSRRGRWCAAAGAREETFLIVDARP